MTSSPARERPRRAPAQLLGGSAARARVFALTALACIAAIPSAARAENPASVPDPVAQALFQDGRDLVDKGQWDAGCTKFEASMLLYPAASTLLNIAACHEHQGKLASAWSAYKRVLVLNRETLGEERRRAIDELADAQIKALTPRLPKIKLAMARPVLGVTLRKDGEIVPTAVIGTEIPVDAGDHEIVAEAPGYRAFRERVEAKESALHVINIDLVSLDAPDPGGAPVRFPTWTLITGSAGLALVGAAVVFRVDQAFVEGRQSALCKGDPEASCPPATAYDPAADNERKNRDFGLFVGLGIGGVLALGAAVYGVVSASRPAKPPAAAFVFTRGGAAAAVSFQF